MEDRRKMASYIKTTDDNKVLFNDDGELIYYIPEKFFELNVASIIGEYVETMGLFSYCRFSKSGKQIDKPKILKCPTMIKCKPSYIEKINNYQLEGTKKPNSYRILKFHKDDELLSNTAIPKDVGNVEKFVNLLTRGNLPDNIPYNEIHEYILLNAELNGFSYKVSNQIIGLIISELCRNPKDLSQPFRYTKMEDMLDYKSIRITEVPKYTSPYTAITSENPDEAIAAAMTTTGNAESPLEKAIMN